MGIRYYAYAFDSELTDSALADPYSVIGSDPLADAWGLEPGFSSGVTDFTPAIPERDLLYLDKAWRHLQALTEPRDLDGPPRPAYRMFEGSVTNTECGWISWTRAIPPDEVGEIAADLATLDRRAIESIVAGWGSRRGGDDEGSEVDYAADYLEAAKRFVTELTREGRGFAYLIE